MEGKRNLFFFLRKPWFIFFNPSILALSAGLVNKQGEWVNHSNHLLSWTKGMKGTGQAKWVCGFSPLELPLQEGTKFLLETWHLLTGMFLVVFWKTEELQGRSFAPWCGKLAKTI